jgi:hypothetical protein
MVQASQTDMYIDSVNDAPIKDHTLSLDTGRFVKTFNLEIAAKDPKAIQAYQEAEGIAREVFAEDLLKVGLTTNDPAIFKASLASALIGTYEDCRMETNEVADALREEIKEMREDIVDKGALVRNMHARVEPLEAEKPLLDSRLQSVETRIARLMADGTLPHEYGVQVAQNKSCYALLYFILKLCNCSSVGLSFAPRPGRIWKLLLSRLPAAPRIQTVIFRQQQLQIKR